jgi:beta-glucosidase
MRLITNTFLAIVLCIPLVLAKAQEPRAPQPQLGSRLVPLITVNGLRFRDLNRDGKLEPYEDWRLPAQQRAADLVGRLSLEEKAGLMMHASAPAKGSPEIGRGTEYDLDRAREMMSGKKVTTFITRLTAPPAAFAEQNNLLQELAEGTRFAIPLTISTDPRNNFKATVGASNDAGGFSQWPDMTGMAAIGRSDVTRKFGDIVRQEYLSVGIQMALSPQADLSTEPRWSRIDGTFGEDPQLVKSMAEAYIAGFQDGETGLHPGSVACVVKHWVGYGAMKDGLDAHNSYSRHAVFSGDAFEQHLVPFEGAFAAGVAVVMPTYAILDGVTVNGKPLQPVGAGFNKQLLTELLREKYHFDGVILSDWLVTESCRGECLQGAAAGVSPSITPGAFGMPWGVEDLTVEQRYARALDAGIDQFGGVADSSVIVKLVREGKISEARINESARRLLRQKFDLGLFEDPYVDPAKAAMTAGQVEFKQAALKAQEQSMVLLTNKKLELPERRQKVFLVGVSSAAATSAGLTPVATMGEAEYAMVRLAAPHQELHPGYFFGSRQHEGDLDFKADDPQLIEFEKVARQLPTVAIVYLDRPAILAPLIEKASAVLVDFGASDEAVLAVIQGKAAPEGRLPFELPKTMDAVREQRPDLPHDSIAPEFPIHFGLSYQGLQ